MVRNSFGDENSAPIGQEDEPVERLLVERRRVLAGLAAEDFAAVLREREAVPVLLARLAAGLADDRVVAGLADDDFAAVLRDRVAVRFVAVDREAVRRGAAVLAALPPSSLATRSRRLATSALRSSSIFRSPMASRKRVAAWATSSTRSRPRFCAPVVPSFNVRSTALRTASTGSPAPEPFLSFFFLSFLAMGASLI